LTGGTVISAGDDEPTVAAQGDPALRARLEGLERDIRELRARLAALERLVGNAGEHSADRTVVREKAVYDWQG